MRHMKTGMLCLISVIALTACEKRENGEFSKTLKNVNVIDESNLNDIMLSVADPNEAVTYFQRATRENPDRLDLQRGLGKSLLRAKRATEASVILGKIVQHEEATNDDRIDYANALIREGKWKEAEKALDAVPPTFETFERYRLEAIIADTNKEWKKADSFYQTAVGLTTTPASVLNNWGYSKLSRGDYVEAERLFGEAITYDPSLFTAKNNMVLARGARKNYRLPIIQVSQTERAQLLHTMALTAIKQGDVEVGKDLLGQAIETHPQHFEAAIRSLRTLES
ncbi:Flp pilus assembly protein TadD [Litoreibacter ponti]|uniref:Flp pilus assembly protein TadD n=1 Tax=Litoreibacter ponti TaxID=1510457 RepID=A0A2T6BLH1_9RHOB|nr:tetratricopeptide repeat protein [Litoreibacter ponti]PTX56902.1 Flp pilus assembly protein TadD [Litoreibacter ponti]